MCILHTIEWDERTEKENRNTRIDTSTPGQKREGEVGQKISWDILQRWNVHRNVPMWHPSLHLNAPTLLCEQEGIGRRSVVGPTSAFVCARRCMHVYRCVTPVRRSWARADVERRSNGDELSTLWYLTTWAEVLFRRSAASTGVATLGNLETRYGWPRSLFIGRTVLKVASSRNGGVGIDFRDPPCFWLPWELGDLRNWLENSAGGYGKWAYGMWKWRRGCIEVFIPSI